MTPLDYLKNYTSIIGSCRVIYSRVFENYMDSETRTIQENVNKFHKYTIYYKNIICSDK